MSKRILIIGPSWVGDMVMAQSLFIRLKQQYPECLIDVLAPIWTYALLERMPEVSTAIPMPALARGQLGLFERIRLGKELRANRYQQAILLPNTWKSALIPFVANIPLRTGYLGESRWGLLNDIRHLDKLLLTQTVQRFVALAGQSQSNAVPLCPAPSLKADKNQQQQLVEKYGLNTNNKILALCPGAEYGEAKRWPARYYAEVASVKIKEGWQVLLLGSKKDMAVAEEINQLNDGYCVNLAGKTSIVEAIDLLALANTVISNDSGLMHIAAALDRDLIAIYGSSDPHFTPPLSAKAKIISLNLECSPCFQRECPLAHSNCLVNITPQQIIDEI